MVKKGRRKPSPLPRTSKKVDHGSANEIRVIGQFFRLKRINNPQKLFSNMGKSNAVLLALGTFLGVVTLLFPQKACPCTHANETSSVTQLITNSDKSLWFESPPTSLSRSL